MILQDRRRHARDDTVAGRLEEGLKRSDLTARLRIIATTDLHMHLRGYDYLADRPAPGTGLAAAATMIRELRAEADNALLVDAGDFLQGTPMGDEAAHADLDSPHPAVAAMSALGYDAVALGNHEFNYGLNVLEAALASAEFPVVCANAARSLGAQPAADDTLVAPYALLDRTATTLSGRPVPIRIGVIGFVPPQIANWDREHLHGRIGVRDIVETARARVPELRAAGADLVVALAHTGIGPAEARQGMENAAVPLAAVAGIDALAIGHSHKVFPSPLISAAPGIDPVGGRLHGKPAVMAGAFGSHIGVIDLTLTHDNSTWRVVRGDANAIAVPRSSSAAPDVLAATETAHHQTLSTLRRPLGYTSEPHHSYFAMAGDMSALAPVADAQRQWAQDAAAEAGAGHLPLLVAVAPMKSGGPAGPGHYTDISAGPVARRHIADLYGFPNTAQILHVTGTELRAWLEQAAGAFATIRSGEIDVPLLNPNVPPYHFDVFGGLTYAFDLADAPRFAPDGTETGEGAGRVRDLRHAGVPVAEADVFAVVTTSYRAGGGGSISAAASAPVIATSTETVPELLANHIRESGQLGSTPPPCWRFAPIRGATAIHETGAGGRAHLETADRLGLTLIGQGETGFDRYRLSLS